MAQWGNSPTTRTKKPVWLSQADQNKCYITDEGWIFINSDIHEVLVAIPELSQNTGAAIATDLEFITPSIHAGTTSVQVEAFFNKPIYGTPLFGFTAVSITRSKAGNVATVGPIVGGSNYTDGTYTQVPLKGSISGSKTCLANITVSGGHVTSITNITTSRFPSPYIVGETLTAVLPPQGQVQTLSITTAGSGYVDTTNEPTETVSPSAGDGNLTVDITTHQPDGAVLTATVNHPGSGYAVNDENFIDDGNFDCEIKVTALVPTSAGGFSTTVASVAATPITMGYVSTDPNNIRMVFSAFFSLAIQSGEVISLNMSGSMVGVKDLNYLNLGQVGGLQGIVRGTGYHVAKNVPLITVTGSGSGCTVDIVAVGSQGEILSLNVNQPGRGYAFNDLLKFPGGNVPASIQVGSVLEQSTDSYNIPGTRTLVAS